jgi:hypothetical protein
MDNAYLDSRANVHMSFEKLPSVSYAAVGYPAIRCPADPRPDGRPACITLIGKPSAEIMLLAQAYAVEQASRLRSVPADYSEPNAQHGVADWSVRGGLPSRSWIHDGFRHHCT